MNLYEVIEIINSLESRINTNRNYFAVVVLATVGWLFGRPDENPIDLVDGIMLTVGLSMFFAFNILTYVRASTMLNGALQERAALVREANLHSEYFRHRLMREGTRSELWTFLCVHMVVDSLLIAAIFIAVD